MPTKTVDVGEAKISLKELFYLVVEGTEIVLMEGSTPVARLVPISSPTTPRIAGLHSGAIWTSDDFDEPLPKESGKCKLSCNQASFKERIMLS